MTLDEAKKLAPGDRIVAALAGGHRGEVLVNDEKSLLVKWDYGAEFSYSPKKLAPLCKKEPANEGEQK